MFILLKGQCHKMSVCVYIVKGTVSQDVHLRIRLAKLNNLGPLLTCRSIFEYCFKFVEMFDCDSPESVGFLKTQKCPGINLKTLNLCCSVYILHTNA